MWDGKEEWDEDYTANWTTAVRINTINSLTGRESQGGEQCIICTSTYNRILYRLASI